MSASEPRGQSFASAMTSALRVADSQLLRALYDTAQAVRRGDDPLRTRFSACRRWESRRLAVDATVLLPLLEAEGADTARLRRDHTVLEETFARAQAELDRGAVADFCECTQELMVALSAYRIRAERLVAAHTPAIDAADHTLLGALLRQTLYD
jgi:hypothetical protein